MRPLVHPDAPLMENPRGRLFDRAAGAAVAVVALAARFAYVVQLRRTPLFGELLLDPLYYHDWAKRIAAGDWLSGSTVFEQSPLYAYVLAILQRLAGDDLLVPRIVQAFAGAGSALLVFLIARRVFGRPAALAAGLFMALYGPAIFEDGMIMKECWSVLLTAAMTCALVHSLGSRRGLLAGAGFLLGLAALARDNLILLAPIVALWLVADLFLRSPLAAGRTGEVAVRVLVFAAGVALAVLPVTARNRYVSGEWVLLTAGGGEVFYIGNNPAADGKYSPPEFVRATSVVEHEDFRTEAARRLGRQVTRGEASSYWLDQGMRWIAEHPLDAAALELTKLKVLLNDYELPDNQNYYHHRLFIPFLGWLPTWAPLLALGAAGIVLSTGVWRDALPLYLLGAGYAGSILLFFNFARFRLPLVPLLAVFAGEALVELPGHLFRGGSPVRRVAPFAAAAVALAIAWLPPGNDALHIGQSESQLSSLLARAGRFAEARPRSDRAIGLLESIYRERGGSPGRDGHGVAPAADRSRPAISASYYGVLMGAYEARSRIERGSGDAAAALAWLERAAIAAPDADIGFDVLVACGEALLAANRIPDAMAVLTRARGQDDRHLRLALLYAQALHRSGRPREALGVVESALDANPHPPDLDLADANFGLALIYRDLGDIPRMKFQLRETLGHNPDHPRGAWIRETLAAAERTP